MLNKVILIGYVGNEPEIKETSNGKKMAVFNLATSEKWKDKNTGERKEKTDWHRVVVFSEHLIGVIDQYVRKGSKLYIDGTLSIRKWTDKDGIERTIPEINLKSARHQLVMLDKKDHRESSPPDESYE